MEIQWKSEKRTYTVKCIYPKDFGAMCRIMMHLYREDRTAFFNMKVLPKEEK